MQGTILDYGVPAAKSAYEGAVNNPLTGQASGYLSDVIGGKYLDFAQNKPLADAMALYGRRAQTQYETMASRAGRGAMGPDMLKAAMEGIGTAQITPLMDLYKGERTLQQGAAGMAPGQVMSGMAPAMALNEILKGYGGLGQSGTSQTNTTSSNPMGMAMTALGLLTGNPAAMLGLGATGALQGGGGAGDPFSRVFPGGGTVSGYTGSSADLPWLSKMY